MLRTGDNQDTGGFTGWTANDGRLTCVALKKKECDSLSAGFAIATFEAAIILFQTADFLRAAAAQQRIDKLQSDTY